MIQQILDHTEVSFKKSKLTIPSDFDSFPEGLDLCVG